MTNKSYIKYYSKALYQLLSRDSDDSIALTFLKTLKKRGHLRLTKSVLKSLEKKLISEKEKQILNIEIVNEWDDKKFGEIIEGEISNNNISYKEKVVKIVPEIVGGFRIRVGNTLIDRSYRKELIEIYENVTSDVNVK